MNSVIKLAAISATAMIMAGAAMAQSDSDAPTRKEMRAMNSACIAEGLILDRKTLECTEMNERQAARVSARQARKACRDEGLYYDRASGECTEDKPARRGKRSSR